MCPAPVWTATSLAGYKVPFVKGGPDFRCVCVLDLTDASDHNGNGMGQVDIASRRFYDKMNPELGYVNCLTSTAINSGKMPDDTGH